MTPETAAIGVMIGIFVGWMVASAYKRIRWEATAIARALARHDGPEPGWHDRLVDQRVTPRPTRKRSGRR